MWGVAENPMQLLKPISRPTEKVCINNEMLIYYKTDNNTKCSWIGCLNVNY